MLSPPGCYTLTIDAGFTSAAIFVSIYEEIMDLLRAVIIGTPGTPYHDELPTDFFLREAYLIAYGTVIWCLQPKVRALIVEGWRSTLYGHRSLNKGFPSRLSRNISTMTTISSSSKEGSKMLITAVLDGMTRLTRSGLSMTDWKFTSSLPPSVRGIVGYITVRLGVRLSALFALGAGQGLIGWWMVKSGLEEPESEYVQPRESHYRLAAHLTSAFAIYCGLLWNGLSVVRPEPPAGSMAWVRGAAKLQRLVVLKGCRRLCWFKLQTPNSNRNQTPKTPHSKLQIDHPTPASHSDISRHRKLEEDRVWNVVEQYRISVYGLKLLEFFMQRPSHIFVSQNGLDTKVEKSRKQLKERKNRAKKIHGVKKTKADLCQGWKEEVKWMIKM
ncbi:hypothetical protein IFM89_039196 [Coptis chinensis]|uniref:Uncharacterized protein n=1 Tax=Coptis chinensis TaxID=261450 RepID=A0A835M381_9MAGN|nr:hypothetical protein IFM89_039196 [Coptis chinensis]